MKIKKKIQIKKIKQMRKNIIARNKMDEMKPEYLDQLRNLE